MKVESMKKIFWSISDILRNVLVNYFGRCNIFVLEEQLKIMSSKVGEEMEDFMALVRDEFITTMFRMHAANSSRNGDCVASEIQFQTG